MTEVPVAVVGSCRRSSDCPVAAGGSPCALGHADLLECPEFEPSEEAAESSPDEAASPAEPTPSGEGSGSVIDVRGRNRIVNSGTTRDIYLGEALTVGEAGVVLHEHPATVVVPLGTVRVGKTTLIASIWERVCTGTAGEWAFAESLTPYAFEERCHLASFYSGRTRPDTARTPEGANKVLLHLGVARPAAEGMERRDILLADVSGEHATNFVRADEPGPLPPLLAAAHVVAILVDGEALSTAAPWGAINDARALARVLVERGGLRSGTRLLAVVTKWDRCESANAIEETLARLTAELTAVASGIEVLRCAARSERDSAVAEGMGIAEFLEAVLDTSRRDGDAANRPPPEAIGSSLHGFVHGGGVLRRRTLRAGSS